MTMPGMAPMHENVHQRARQQDQPRQNERDVDPVLDQKSDSDQATRAIKADQGPAWQRGNVHESNSVTDPKKIWAVAIDAFDRTQSAGARAG